MRGRQHQEPPEARLLVTAVMILLAFGAVMVYSASSAEAVLAAGGGGGAAFLIKTIIWAVIGLAVMGAAARTPLSTIRRLTGPLLALSIFLVFCTFLPGIGVEVNGARRWLGAGPFTFQPAELLKLALVLQAVRLLAERPQRAQSFHGVLPLVLTVGAACGLVAVGQSDLGSALVAGFAVTAVLVAAGVPFRLLGLLALASGACVLVLALMEPYRVARIVTFFDPWGDRLGDGYQVVQGQIALGSGGLTGVGLGGSVQKASFRPEAHTDFLLAVVGEELGVLGVWVLLSLYGVVGYCGLRIAKQATGAYGALLAAGITSLLLGQALLNVFTVIGLAPLTGVPLPFVSNGSSSVMVLLFGIGLVLNIARGGTVGLRAVAGSRADGQDVPDRGGRDSGARGAGAVRRRAPA